MTCTFSLQSNNINIYLGFFNPLTTGNTWIHIHVLVTIEADDALELKHQAIGIHNIHLMLILEN